MAERSPDMHDSRQWPDWSLWPDGKLGRDHPMSGRALGIGVSSLFLLFLLQPVGQILAAGYGPVLTEVLLAAIACYAASYPVGFALGTAASHAGRIAIVVVVYALGLLPAVLLRSPEYLTDMIFAICVGLMLLPRRYGFALGLGVAAAEIVWMWFGSGQVNWGDVANLTWPTCLVAGLFALAFTIGQLRAARDQVAALAVTQERERVARDLHDILGHSLSTITVKAGLARRVLESSGDIEQAIAEIRGLEELSRQAHADVRATVSDYRTVTLSAEIAGARAALRAAGVQAELPRAVDDVAPELQGVFGYVVREAVTNVLRHSNAERCRIRLGRDWIEITDDGIAGTGPSEGTAGHGLAGLVERLAAVSATVEYGRRAGGGFRVLARGSAPAEQVAESSPERAARAVAGTA